MGTNISVATTTSIFTLNETSGSHINKNYNRCRLVGNVQFAINISEKPSASIFWYSAFKDFYPQCGGTWLLWNVGIHLRNYRVPQINRHLYWWHLIVIQEQQKGSKDVQSQLNSLSVLLLATCFGFWKRHHQATKYIHEERQFKYKLLELYFFR